MSTKLEDLNNVINDRRRDASSDSIDMTTEGLRAINSTLELWQQFHDWPFTIEKQRIEYNPGIDTYDLESNYKGAIDLTYRKPSKTDEFAMVSSGSFDTEVLKVNRFAIEVSGQTEQIRINSSRGNTASIHAMSTYDGNGTWSASGAASNIGTDSFEHYDQPASISFDYSGTSGVITVSDMSAIDIERYVDRGKIFLNSKLDSIANFISIGLEIGSDGSNYYSETVTSDYLGNTLDTAGWNKFKFDPWSSETGTVDQDAIDYIKITIKYSSDPDIKIRMENLFVAEDVPIDFEYYSTNMVKDSAGVKKAKFPDPTDSATVLWSGKWDFINESFVNSVLENIFWMTGEYNDRNIAVNNVRKIVSNLQKRLPSRRRYPELQFYVE